MIILLIIYLLIGIVCAAYFFKSNLDFIEVWGVWWVAFAILFFLILWPLAVTIELLL